jgi:hypothetical protein
MKPIRVILIGIALFLSLHLISNAIQKDRVSKAETADMR